MTCYDAHLLRCRLWFPIPKVIVQFLDFFRLLIGQITVSGLQHLIGILVLSYERGMPLSVDYLDALLTPARSRKTRRYFLSPRTDMTIIKGFASNPHSFWTNYFIVKIDTASVEESCIPIFRSRWGYKGTLAGYPLYFFGII